MGLPRDGDDYPLWLLVAAKKSIFTWVEDPTLEDGRIVLSKIDEALAKYEIDGKPGVYAVRSEG